MAVVSHGEKSCQNKRYPQQSVFRQLPSSSQMVEFHLDFAYSRVFLIEKFTYSLERFFMSGDAVAVVARAIDAQLFVKSCDGALFSRSDLAFRVLPVVNQFLLSDFKTGYRCNDKSDPAVVNPACRDG